MGEAVEQKHELMVIEKPEEKDIMNELGMVREDFNTLTKDFDTLAKEFTELKIHTIEHNSNLETILAKLQTTMEMSVKEHERFNNTLQQHTTDISQLKSDITAVQHDVNSLDQTIKDQGKRISGIEKISYWVYVVVGVVAIFAFIASHYLVGRDIINHHKNTVAEIKSAMENNAESNTTTNNESK